MAAYEKRLTGVEYGRLDGTFTALLYSRKDQAEKVLKRIPRKRRKGHVLLSHRLQQFNNGLKNGDEPRLVNKSGGSALLLRE